MVHWRLHESFRKEISPVNKFFSNMPQRFIMEPGITTVTTNRLVEQNIKTPLEAAVAAVAAAISVATYSITKMEQYFQY